MKLLQKEIPAITWLVGAIAQEGNKRTFTGVSKDIAQTLLRFHFATIKRDRGVYTVTLAKRGSQFVSNLMMLMGMNPKPEDKKLEKHITELAKQIDA